MTAGAAPLLAVEDVHVSFGGVRVLDGPTLEVSEGEIAGLIGPNGAGKTTLLNVISGLLRAERGAVKLEGREVSRLGAEQRARLGIARTFQNLGLIGEETVRTNLLASMHLRAGYRGSDLIARPWRCLRRERELEAEAERIAEFAGIASELDERVMNLSFGIARAVEIAAAFATSARVLLLDEPTTGLDRAERGRLRDMLLNARANGVAVVVIAHDVEFIMTLSDRVYALAEGRVIFHGPPAAVQREPAVIEAYFGRSTSAPA